MADDYTMIPEREFLQVKKEVEQIKKDPFAAYSEKDEIVKAMQDLTKTLSSLNNIFEKAADELKLEERSTETIGKKLDPLFEKLDLLIDQNKKIAKGLVAVADMLESKGNRDDDSSPLLNEVSPTQLPPMQQMQQQYMSPPPQMPLSGRMLPSTPPPAPKRMFNF